MIGHIVTNKKDNITDSGIIPCGVSDHDLVYVIRYTRLPKIRRDPKIVTVRSTKNLDNDSLIKDLNELPLEVLKALADNPNDLWSSWKSFFRNILNKHAPIKTMRVRGNNLPYVKAEIKSMMKQRGHLRGKANKTGSKYLRKAFQNLHNQVNYTLRELRSDYYTKKIDDNKYNLRNTWKVLIKVINSKNKCNLVEKITANNTEVTDKQEISPEISDQTNKYFASIGSNLAKGIPEGNFDPITLVKQSQSIFRFKKITPIQIPDLIMKSANGKATGVDIVSDPLLKTASPVISSQLADIFNQCIEHGTFPSDSKIGKVIPIFKSGRKTIAEIITQYLHYLPSQEFSKRYCPNSCINVLQTVECWGDKQWGFRSLDSTMHALQKSVNN